MGDQVTTLQVNLLPVAGSAVSLCGTEQALEMIYLSRTPGYVHLHLLIVSQGPNRAKFNIVLELDARIHAASLCLDCRTG
jgi:hypothetical protein